MKEWAAEAGRSWDEFGIEQRISVAEGGPDEWRAAADEWRDLGATHLSVATMGAGLASPDAHLERLGEAKAALIP